MIFNSVSNVDLQEHLVSQQQIPGKKNSVLSTRSPQEYSYTQLKNIKITVLGAEIALQNPGPEGIPVIFVARLQGLEAGTHGAS